MVKQPIIEYFWNDYELLVTCEDRLDYDCDFSFLFTGKRKMKMLK